jgi:hypothetical protein
MTFIMGSVGRNAAWLSCDGGLELASRAAIARMRRRHSGAAADETVAEPRLVSRAFRKIRISPSGKVAVGATGVVAIAGLLLLPMRWRRRETLDVFEQHIAYDHARLWKCLRALPLTMVAVGYSERRGRMAGLLCSSTDGMAPHEFLDSHAQCLDIATGQPESDEALRLSDEPVAAVDVPRLHRLAAIVATRQSKAGQLGGCAIGGMMQTVKVTRDGAKLVQDADLDELVNAPTPYASHDARQLGLRGAAMITASCVAFWLRRVGALGLFVIAALACVVQARAVQGLGGESLCMPGEPPAETCLVALTEDIPIFQKANHKDRDGGPFPLQLDTDWWREGRVFSDPTMAQGSVGQVGDISLNRELPDAHYGAPEAGWEGWRSAVVGERGPDIEGHRRGGGAWHVITPIWNRVEKQISPFHIGQRIGGFFGGISRLERNVDLPFACKPQLIGGTPKRVSEQGYKTSGGESETSLVRINEVTLTADEIASRESPIRLALRILGFSLVLCFVLARLVRGAERP